VKPWASCTIKSYRQWGYSWVAAGLIVSLLTYPSAPFLSDIRVGNVNRLIFCFLCGCALLRHPKFSRLIRSSVGVLLGMGILFKPVIVGPAFMLVWLNLIHRRWREVVVDSCCIVAGGALMFCSELNLFR
jgi:hypothetical protein